MYFDQWAAGLHAILAHVGGNEDAQVLLWHLPSVFNIDENRWEISLANTGTPLFWRENSRQPPHNLYTSTVKLRQYAVQHRQEWSYQGAYLLHKPAAPMTSRAHSGSLTLTFEDPLTPQRNSAYEVRYNYDRSSNTYLRAMGGSAHVDADTRKQLRPTNIVLMRTGPGVPDVNAGPTPLSISLPTLGKGPAWFFLEGKVTPGSWSQPDQFAPLRFYDTKGKEMALDPGQTWIEVAPSSSPVTWSFH